MKKNKFYIIVPHGNGKISLFNANKIEGLEPYLPSMEAIKVNIDLQGEMGKGQFLQTSTVNVGCSFGCVFESESRYKRQME